MKVRTRFAPSPTGYLHIGGLRTALYAWLFTKKHNGSFVLRIEDTDQQRYVEGSVELIYRTLKEAGLCYDEGPDVGGDYGPYIQSERKQLYREYADKLVACGGAYYCFCTKEELDQKRELAQQKGEGYKYDRTCMHIPLEEAKRRIAAGEPYVVRQKIPDRGEISYEDLVYGHISVGASELEDGILLKSDGMPTYNFANVIDDALMGITHIIRGSEYLSSTPKYNLIYEAFGWPTPAYMHLPPVMRDQHQKLSKRHGDASYEDFIQKGYLKEAIINYIALLGWSPEGNQEIFSLQELVDAFDVKGLSKSPAIFDIHKLTWMNAEYIKQLSEEEFTRLALPYYRQVLDPQRFDLSILHRILATRLEVLTQIPEKIAFLGQMPDFPLEFYTHKKMKTDPEIAKKAVFGAIGALSNIPWTEQDIHDALMALAQALEMKNGQIFWSVRIAITGTLVTPGGAIEAAALLGREETLKRLSSSYAQFE